MNQQPDGNITTIIKVPSRWPTLNVSDLWHFRELFFVLVWRDVKVRYKQTALGVLWAVFQPLTTMIIFSVFFGKVAGVSSSNVPYPIFVFAGLLYWNYFAQSLTASSNSFIENESIVKKIFMPRIILPLAAVLTPVVDFLITFVILLLLMLWFGTTPQLIGLVIIPLSLLITFLTVSGLGMLLASVNVRYRDVRYILPFFIQMLLFLTPVIYPSTLLAPEHRWILNLNPLTGVIENSRAALLGTGPLQLHSLAVGAAVAVVICLVGIFYLKKTEQTFADIA